MMSPGGAFACSREAERQRAEARREAYNDQMHQNVKKELEEKGYNMETHELGGTKADTEQTVVPEPLPQETLEK